MTHKAPLFLPAISLATGILIQGLLALALWQLLAAACIIIALSVALRHQRHFFMPCVAAFWLVCGMTVMTLNDPLHKKGHYSHLVHEEATLTGIVVKTPSESPKCHRMEVEVTQVDSHDAEGRMMLYVLKEGNDAPNYGDKIQAQVRIEEPFTSDSTHDFDYRRYLLHKGITHTGFSTSCQVIESKSMGGIRQWAYGIQQGLLIRIRSLNISESQIGIAEALLLGWDDDLDAETRGHFRDAGIAHLLCVSGLHVGIVAAMLGWLLLLCGRGPWGRRIRGIIQLLGVWAFVLITGMAPATTRAAILFSFFIIKDCFLLQSNSFNILSASALLMLCINPFLIYDVGFQLSYSAVAGIIAFTTPFYNLIPWPDKLLFEKEIDKLSLRKKLRKILPLKAAQWAWQVLCVTTAATLATLPLTLYYFHRFPLYFVIANMTIVPLAGVLLATIMLTMLIPQLAPLLGWELGITEGATHCIATLPKAVIEEIAFSPFKAILSGILIILLAILLRRASR